MFAGDQASVQKRLAPFLPELLERLRRRQALREFPVAVQARVARMSAATVHRALLKQGSFEMDLVAHCGWSGAGQFLYTLSMVDVATGWVVCAGLGDKRQETVFHAFQRLQAELPFRILGLDRENGNEFINHVLLDYCADGGITFTRSRPYPQERHPSGRTEKLGRGAPAGRLGPTGAAALPSTRAHP